MDPIRIFVGTEPKTHLAYKVLEHSIRTRTLRPVEITPMIGPEWEYPTTHITVGTGFSLRRWMIPNACGRSGHAIYLDADQIVLADVGELYDIGRQSLGTEAVLACTFQPDKYNKRPAPQTSVMVLDCGRAAGRWQFEIERVIAHLRRHPTREDYARLMHADGLPVGAPLPVGWNHLNVYDKAATKLLHYTKEPEQPWYKPDHPLAGLWRTELEAAIKAGVISRKKFEESLAAWGKKQDWRPTNGLHPFYRKYLPTLPRV